MTEPAIPTRVLIVEDDPNIVDLIRSNLAVRGFDTLVSADGSKALPLIETEEPDMVLLDLMLPEVDGFELCRQIRERSIVAIIVVSARGGERDKVTALNVGADDYMTKPFGIEELLARILATLRRTRPAEAAPRPPRRSSRSATSRSTWPASGSASAARRCTSRRPSSRCCGSSPSTGASCCPALTCSAGSGARLRDRDRVRPGVHQAAAGQAREPDGPPLIITQPRAGYRIAGE